ncbi:MAG TPA: hypothetical protein DCW31_10390 [Lactobacillus sp.]|nr:hypothetical protein [Lactobacillus sp.]
MMKRLSRWQVTVLIEIGFAIISMMLFAALIHGTTVFATGDYHFHQNRIESLYEALKHGNLMPRVDTYFAGGYGYAASLFYPTLFLYIPATFRLLGFSSAQVYFGTLIGIVWATFATTEFAGRKMGLSRVRSVMFALLYGLSTYHLQDVFSRQDMGEAMAMVFFPLVLASLVKLNHGDKHAWLWLALSMTAVGYAHMLSLEMMGLFCVIYALTHWRTFMHKRTLLSVGGAALTAVLLLSAYLIPVGEQLMSQTFQVTSTPLVYISKEAVAPLALIKNSLTNQVFHASTVNVGPIILIGSVVGLGMAYKQRHNRVLATTALVMLLMTTSLFPWALLNHTMFNTLQFPWRLFSIISLLVAYNLADLKYGQAFERAAKGVLPLAAAAMLLFGLQLGANTVAASPSRVESETSFDKVDSYYIGAGHEYLPKSLSYSKILANKKRTLIYNDEDVTITATRDGGRGVEFHYTVHDPQKQAKINLPLVYYKGMQAVNTLDHRFVSTEESRSGMTQLKLSGSGNVAVNYVGTPLQRTSVIVTSVTVATLIVGISLRRRHRRFLLVRLPRNKSK